MSVIAIYARLNQNDLERLRGDPNWLDQLDRGGPPGGQIMDVDKACDGLVWLLSRMHPPSDASVEGSGFILRTNLAPLLYGGRKDPQLDAPYGPASVLDPQQVHQLSHWLKSIDADQLRERYDPKSMVNIYPQIWVRDGAAAFEDYLLPRFERLRQFIEAAATAEQYVLVFFS